MKTKLLSHYIILILVLISCIFISCNNTGQSQKSDKDSLYNLQNEFVQHQFGIMMHFNIGTFSNKEWSTGNESPEIFNPKDLDCEQWAKACKQAGANFAILTTKHHDGFCLWDSETTEHDVMSSPLKRDVLKEYTDAFRKHGVQPTFYYSMWDRNANIDENNFTPKKMEFILTQLTELLSNYGEIPLLIIDGWCWKMGHNLIPYQTIREHIKKLQPNCMISDHTHVQSPWDVDIIYFEGPMGEFPAENNIYASMVALNCSSGWFWHPRNETELTMTADEVVEKIKLCQPRYCNFMINVSPNRNGLYDENLVEMLTTVGKKWQLDKNRPKLPVQPTALLYPLHPKSVSATGSAFYLIDGMSGGKDFNTFWISDSSQASIMLDLGEIKKIGTLSYLPQQFALQTKAMQKKSLNPDEPEYFNRKTELQDISGGRVLKYKIKTSTDNSNWIEVKNGEFENSSTLKVVEFNPVEARYATLEILSTVNGKYACIDELAVGRTNKN